MAIPKQMASLSDLLDRATAFFEEQKVDSEAAFAMSLAIDEIFSNFVKYQAMGKQDVEVELRIESGSVKAIMIDHDVDEYDFTKQAPADMDALAASASPGGRGIYLAKQLVDKIDYAYNNRMCTVTLTKSIRSSRV